MTTQDRRAEERARHEFTFYRRAAQRAAWYGDRAGALIAESHAQTAKRRIIAAHAARDAA